MRRGRRGNNHNSGGGGGGPLMTGHLHDIELQLELLKRKREMIEQQQQLLVMEQQFKTSASRHSYDQMRYDEPDPHGSNRDFSHLYETGPKHRNQFGKKRQAENQWQYESAPKRIPPKKKNQNQSQFNQHSPGNAGSGNFRNQRPNQGQGSNQSSKVSARQPTPLMDIKVPKQSIGQKIASQKAPQKTPNKNFTPSKVSKPKAPAAPNKLASHTVAERKSLVATAAATAEKSSEEDVSRMLLPDRVPSQQVSGRLELALGAIMKNIRVLINGHPQHTTVLRSIQLQRVMKQTVRERIRTVMLGKVVGSLIDILAIYREEFPEETDADILNIALEAGGISTTDRDANTKLFESEDPGEYFRVNLICLLETKLNEMFSKLEEIYGNPQPTVQPTVPTEQPTEPSEKPTEPSEKPTEPSEKPTEPSEGQTEVDKVADNKKNEDTQEYKDFLNTDLKLHEVKRVLPRLLKKYIPFLIKLLNVDGMFQKTKAAVTMKANEKAAKMFGTKGTEEGQGDANTAAPETPSDNRQMYNLPYYVKIMGRPSLPKRKVMQGFLSQFNPKSIKKHRSIHNLLFVGFTEQTDFDAVVGADGTVIGRSTLSIRSSKGGTRESGENNESSISNDISQVEVKKEDQCEGNIINSELDIQITDLLSSIRKSEEEDTDNKDNGDKASEETDNNDGVENPEIAPEQAENNAETVKTEQAEEGVGNDEVMDADNQENIDEIVSEENLGDEPADDSETQNTETTDEATAENPEISNGTDKPSKDENSQETNGGEVQMDTEPTVTGPAKAGNQSDDKVGELKNTGRSTPSRMSARLANVTPSTIRTRRASKLASQNDV